DSVGEIIILRAAGEVHERQNGDACRLAPTGRNRHGLPTRRWRYSQRVRQRHHVRVRFEIEIDAQPMSVLAPVLNRASAVTSGIERAHQAPRVQTRIWVNRYEATTCTHHAMCVARSF